jgi:hypothetical protein
VPAKAGHAISDHLHSANPLADTEGKTLFISMDDMVALTLVVQSPEGVSTLTDLRPDMTASSPKLSTQRVPTER